MATSSERPIETDYLYLPDSNEPGNTFASNVSRLVPKLSVPYDAKTYTARYFRPGDGQDFVVSAFIIDRDMEIPTEDRPRFMLGFTASLLDALKEGEEDSGVSTSRQIESIAVEGSTLDAWVARYLDVKHKANNKRYPLRLQGKRGERVITKTGDPAFPDIVAARSLINSFYMRYEILSLGVDMQWRPEGSRPTNEEPVAVVEEIPTDQRVAPVEPAWSRALPHKKTGVSDEEIASLEGAVDLDKATWMIATFHSVPDEHGYPTEDIYKKKILDTPVVEHTDDGAPEPDEPERTLASSYYDDDLPQRSAHPGDDPDAYLRDRLA